MRTPLYKGNFTGSAQQRGSTVLPTSEYGGAHSSGKTSEHFSRAPLQAKARSKAVRVSYASSHDCCVYLAWEEGLWGGSCEEGL